MSLSFSRIECSKSARQRKGRERPVIITDLDGGNVKFYKQKQLCSCFQFILFEFCNAFAIKLLNKVLKKVKQKKFVFNVFILVIQVRVCECLSIIHECWAVL